MHMLCKDLFLGDLRHLNLLVRNHRPSDETDNRDLLPSSTVIVFSLWSNSPVHNVSPAKSLSS